MVYTFQSKISLIEYRTDRVAVVKRVAESLESIKELDVVLGFVGIIRRSTIQLLPRLNNHSSDPLSNLLLKPMKQTH